jgi:NADH dehydrogenase [ubiquinone] 1 alpha subcomplex assembly factor 1
MAYAEEDKQMLLSFDKPEAAKQWQTINDNVMGGVSEGKCRITKAALSEKAAVGRCGEKIVLA